MNLNFDHEAAVAAQTIIEQIGAGESENLIRKALGVVQEDGVYAAALYLYAKGSDKGGKILDVLLTKANDVTGQPVPSGKTARLAYLTQHVTGNLPTLLLVKSLWEQTLIYARYAAKIS